MHPYYVIRALGGALFLIGALLMAFNLWKTMSTEVSAAPAGFKLAPAE
jgi:cytochrome c oxidase cbb3-type subunit 1